MRNTAPKDAAELEALETREWLESLDYVLQSGGPVRVSKLLRELSDHAAIRFARRLVRSRPEVAAREDALASDGCPVHGSTGLTTNG